MLLLISGKILFKAVHSCLVVEVTNDRSIRDKRTHFFTQSLIITTLKEMRDGKK